MTLLPSPTEQASQLREREEAEICALASNVEVVNSYRIERREEELTFYWWQTRDGRYSAWMGFPESATIFTEAERDKSLRQEVRGSKGLLPPGGIWVQLPAATIECNGCSTVETLKGSPRELAEHVYTLKHWMITDGNQPLCYQCQGDNGPVSDDDVRADEYYEELTNK